MSAKISVDKNFGDQITFEFPKRSYEDGPRKLSLYVTGMNEVSATVHSGNGKYINWFLSADDLLELKNWLDEHIVPARAAVRSKYTDGNAGFKKTSCGCGCRTRIGS